MIEAKKGDIELGLGQCAAQMLGCRLFNEQKDNPIRTIHGCVSNGDDWQFMKLEDHILHIDQNRYYINELGKILGVFQRIVDFYLKEDPS